MILVLTTPRTGSTWFCKHLSETHSLDNLGEYFGEHIIATEDQVNKLDFIKSNPDVVIKCFPWHLNNSRGTFPRASFLEKTLFKLADKIYILIRSDFTDQCKSYYLANSTGVWSGEPQDPIVVRTDANLYNYAVSHLQDGYMQLADYHKRLQCEVIDYAQLPLNRQERYVRPVTWDVEPSVIDFDIKSIFGVN